MIALIYASFAHYREPVLRQLLQSGVPLELFASSTDPFGALKVLQPTESLPFHEAFGVVLPGGVFIQPAAIRLAFSRRHRTIIYLGDAHFACTWIGALLARLLGKRVFFWTHGYTRRDTGVKAIIRKAFYSIPDGLLLYGHRGRALALEAGIPAGHLHVIHNSLDFENQQALLKELSTCDLSGIRQTFFPGQLAPIVLVCSRLTKRKRIDLAIRAVGLLKRQGHMVNILVVGEGSERLDLESLASSEAVPCRFVGALYTERDLARCFLACAVVVSPGDVGLTAIHAMGYGRPVISHDCLDDQMPEVEAVVEGVTGLLYRYNDTTSLSKAIFAATQTLRPSAEVERACIERIRANYSPSVQARLILESIGALRTTEASRPIASGDNREQQP